MDGCVKYASHFSPVVAGQTPVFCSMMQECGASGMVIAEMIALLPTKARVFDWMLKAKAG